MFVDLILLPGGGAATATPSWPFSELPPGPPCPTAAFRLVPARREARSVSASPGLRARALHSALGAPSLSQRGRPGQAGPAWAFLCPGTCPRPAECPGAAGPRPECCRSRGPAPQGLWGGAPGVEPRGRHPSRHPEPPPARFVLRQSSGSPRLAFAISCLSLLSHQGEGPGHSLA